MALLLYYNNCDTISKITKKLLDLKEVRECHRKKSKRSRHHLTYVIIVIYKPSETKQSYEMEVAGVVSKYLTKNT